MDYIMIVSRVCEQYEHKYALRNCLTCALNQQLTISKGAITDGKSI